jgi:hypothetical protein
MNMPEGLVIAFICKGPHPTVGHYHTFGTKFWDDCKGEPYKKGFYFAYYFKMETVRIHRILDVLPSNKRPDEMKDWYSNGQILCLSNPIKEFTWEEWTQDLGIGAPYANQHHTKHTIGWSMDELELRFPHFDFKRFKTILEEIVLKEEVDEELEEDLDLVDQIYQRVFRKTTDNIVTLRQDYMALEDKKIHALKEELENILKEKEEIQNGSRDSEIIKRETELKMNHFLQVYL